MQPKSVVTIKDVALAAECGVSTVSRVLNNSGPVSPAVRARVEKAAKELGFTFSGLGRALQSRKTMTVGCLVPSLANPVFAEAVQGVQAALGGSGYQLLILCSNYNAEADDAGVAMLLAKGVDALIVTMVEPEHSPAIRRARAMGVPVVLMFHDPRDGFLTSYVDNAAAAREITRRFAGHGHRHIGFVALRFSTSDRSRNRYQACLEECRALGLADPLLIETSEAEAAQTDRLAALLREHSHLTAIFASNDYLAIAIQKAARSLGWHVPRDLSVAGFDGIEIGRLLEAPLATIETDPDAMGRQAAKLLLEMLRGGTPVQPPALPFRFRAGATLAPPNPERSDDSRVAARPSSDLPAEPQASTRNDP